jgi:YidC/Oxa1 family membrane protein insertase
VKQEQKNFLIFAVIAALILFAWEPIVRFVYPSAVTRPTEVIAGGERVAKPDPSADPAANTPGAIRDRNAVLAETPRVAIDTPTLKGSINLKGARIDDLVLTRYDQTVDKNSPPIRLFSPSGTEKAYFAGFGWRGTGLSAPDANTVWQASAPALKPGQPVTLSARVGAQVYRIQLAVDDAYMFTATQTVGNAGGQPVQVVPFSYLSRAEKSADVDQWTAHVGAIAATTEKANYINYDEVTPTATRFETRGGYAGFTDHYWLTAVIPDSKVASELRLISAGGRSFQVDTEPASAAQLAPGQQLTQTSRLFAGAKEVNILDRYEEQGGIPHFGRAIDWGWFEVLEKPIFHFLHWIFTKVGNFGVAIILLTLTIRLLLFPIAQKQFAGMAAMRAVQPKMKALQERYKDDKPQLQQKMMELYKTEKVNPLAGCLPTLIQIPILFALYKVLILAIEMRHQPFALWIRDLSAPDPLTPVNLFGLLDFTPPHFLAIGVIPILLGISMWAQFRLNPAPMDDVQKQVFAIMPWMLMFMMAPFAVGLQIYWITSNLLTIAQQQWLYSRHPALRQKPA